MPITSEENRNDDTDLAAETSVSTDLSELDKAALEKIEALQVDALRKRRSGISAKTALYRLQPGDHGGSNVFFNRNGADYRYSLTDGVNGSMYLARTPVTSMKEVFQKMKALKESDLDNYYMGTVVIEKDVVILQLNELISATTLTLHDVTTPTRMVTQRLAAKIHAAGFDGMEYLSNVTGEVCLVLWHDTPSGTGMATTAVQQPLSQFEYEGKDAADILTWDLGIAVNM
ncbi:TPA: RES family NAD+ phosphorylase [Citrobacter freundii]|uniref:RES family NAD+ phosphorylase n=1 Tax=Citrobacter sp. wls757 TaxID=2576417 RepID=UPI0010CA197F|nr:RES family NAD+ phosphorylase [Citrobacter sp. wls757]TKU43463.1 RES domain-containing protein [Citrobacter sp. wls757]HAP0441326.1 RES family NAD+ phosphorylase [Escherichia coli]HDT5995066.1 RES family NAD+ phosphorylase [Citrobacter freundii]HDT6034489.1 RES family NAD+ phosphorylase [Citrobacter freundii]